MGIISRHSRVMEFPRRNYVVPELKANLVPAERKERVYQCIKRGTFLIFLAIHLHLQGIFQLATFQNWVENVFENV